MGRICVWGIPTRKEEQRFEFLVAPKTEGTEDIACVWKGTPALVAGAGEREEELVRPTSDKTQALVWEDTPALVAGAREREGGVEG